MQSLRKITAFIFLFAIIMAGCGEIVSYPDNPIIEYKSYALYRTTDELGNNIFLGKLEFTFTDGDGDVGLYQPDSAAVADSLKYNLFTSLYSMKNGVFEKVDSSLGEQNFRIPYISREGQNKTLKGSITVEFEYKFIEYDTIFYTFYMLDRAFHRSNTDSSEVIIFTGLNL
ncbi:MAG: hypothetical protein H6540_05480 [Bacteroidales bacterium]|nr:hypothetical protein [Bacteroidales bacterium]MCB9013566.1 hypothetical protein [Bacteroidales bacterium]